MPEAQPETDEFILEREYASPRDSVWRAWTEPELLARWYKPNPSCETAVLHFDLKPGGVLRYQMKFGESQFHFERWEFVAIESPSRLQFRQTLTDADDNLMGNPRMPDWPQWMLTTIELEPTDDGTLQRLRWKPYEPTEAELVCFRNASAHLDQGWAAGFDSLEKFLVG
ncbi:MAG: SRPBCC domain-containing protein [Myxococcota bacterium]